MSCPPAFGSFPAGGAHDRNVGRDGQGQRELRAPDKGMGTSAWRYVGLGAAILATIAHFNRATGELGPTHTIGLLQPETNAHSGPASRRFAIPPAISGSNGIPRQ
jgi:hypothetical protein